MHPLYNHASLAAAGNLRGVKRPLLHHERPPYLWQLLQRLTREFSSKSPGGHLQALTECEELNKLHEQSDADQM